LILERKLTCYKENQKIVSSEQDQNEEAKQDTKLKYWARHFQGKKREIEGRREKFQMGRENKLENQKRKSCSLHILLS
jgi:hypothetical protein